MLERATLFASLLTNPFFFLSRMGIETNPEIDKKKKKNIYIYIYIIYIIYVSYNVSMYVQVVGISA